ncbi:MAG: Na-translocating system protein MpsC family protein, partial [Cyanobacteriota bacterium]|nr:Na-translocating system protein MpsC family protein [Cyanobacteriota bacterium]
NKLVVVAENSVTTAEKVLAEAGKTELAQNVRRNLYESIRLKLKSLIEDISQVEVADLLGETRLDTGLTGLIVVFNGIPKVRNRYSADNFRDQIANKKVTDLNGEQDISS